MGKDNAYDNNNAPRIDLAEKHHVTLTVFQGKPYFHIRNNYNNKSVSLGYPDMKSLVEQFEDMRERMKKLKRAAEVAPPPPPPLSSPAAATTTQPPAKKARKVITISSDDDDDEDNE